MEKDYSLLRPFDLEKAKAGEAFGFIECGELMPREFIAGPDSSGGIIIKDERGQFGVSHTYPYNMAPLAWVEGKPVYRGDELYGAAGTSYVVSHAPQENALAFENSTFWLSPHLFTWTPPKKTREVKLLGWLTRYGLLMQVTENYVRGAGWTRVPSEDRTVTVEE